MAASLTGTGPFALYYIYEELVKRPEIELEKNPRYVKTKAKSQRNLIFENLRTIMPVIEIRQKVENVGRETARDLRAESCFDCGESCKPRWDVGRHEERVDLHPGSSEEIIILRIFPTNKILRDIAEDLEDVIYSSEIQILEGKAHSLAQELDQSQNLDEGDHELLTEVQRKISSTNYVVFDKYRSVEFAENPYDPVEVRQMDVEIQAPFDRKHEEAILAQKEQDKNRAFWFIGEFIEQRAEYTYDITLSAENWSSKFEDLKIDISDAINEGKWLNINPRYDGLRKKLDELG